MKGSLSKKFALIFMSVLGVLLVVTLIFVQITADLYTEGYIEDNVKNSHKSINRDIADTLDEAVYGYTRLTATNAANYEANEILFNDALPYEERKNAFLSVVSSASLSKDYLNVVMCIGDSVFATSDDYPLPDKKFSDLLTSDTAPLLYNTDTARYGYVEIGRHLQKTLYSATGYVVFYLNCSLLAESCLGAKLNTKAMTSCFIVDETHQIVGKYDGNDIGKSIFEKDFYPLKEAIINEKIDGKKSIVAITEVSDNYDFSWYIISVSDQSELKKDYNSITYIFLAVGAVCFLVAFLIAIKVSKTTTSPVNKLSKKISSVDLKDRSGIFEMGKEGDEIYELEKSYDDMLKRIFSLMDENKENMETQRKLEIDALQMQINPHFLYNTLDAIAWMAKIKKQPEIEKLTINLAKFFRLSLHKGDKYICLKEEAELVAHFLEIEKIRFPDTISYECNIPEDIGEYKVLKLILQPIVENCAKHAFYGKQEVGVISITAQSLGDDIEIYVEDNGCGFAVPDDFLTHKNSNKKGGYGLFNVNERIRLEYGDGYGLKIDSVIGKGTTVTVKIKKSI